MAGDTDNGNGSDRDMKTIEGPNNRLYLDHEPKTVCLVGMGPSIQDYMGETLTQELRLTHHDEVWGINMVSNCIKTDLCFWMDDLQDQANHKPYQMTPLENTRAVLAGDPGKILSTVADDIVKAWAREIFQDMECLPIHEFDSMVNAFDHFAASGKFSDLRFGTVASIRKAMNEDRSKSFFHPEKNLSGLIEVLAKNGTPVYSSIRRPDLVPHSLDYPIDEIAKIGIEFFGKPYLNNGVAMAIGYGIWKKVKSIKIYGCDFTYPNRNFAESGRACVESWMTLCAFKEIQIILSPNTSLMDQCAEQGIYGYQKQPEIDLGGGKRITYVKADQVQAGKYVSQNYQPEDSSGLNRPLHDGELKDELLRPNGDFATPPDARPQPG